MIAAVIILAVLCAVLPLAAVLFIVSSSNKRLDEQAAAHQRLMEATVTAATQNQQFLFEQLSKAYGDEVATLEGVIKTQNAMVKEHQKTIAKLHTRLAMVEAQASADLNQQYSEFDAEAKKMLAGIVPQEALVTTGNPNGPTPSGWSPPPEPVFDIPDEIPVFERGDEPLDL